MYDSWGVVLVAHTLIANGLAHTGQPQLVHVAVFICVIENYYEFSASAKETLNYR